jgi:arylsulfatase A-like enzyme
MPREPCRPLRAAILLLAAAALSLAGCSRAEQEPAVVTAARPLNVIFVLADTLRADHLGVYGYTRKTSPHVDAFAGRSVLFRNARSQASCTYPSVNSMLTSRYPGVFLGQPGEVLGIPPSIPSIAEILRQRGYRTVAVSASPVVRNEPSRNNPNGGFGRGFDEFFEDCFWQSARCVNQGAVEELARSRERKRPLFLYLHYIDPHDPYAPPRAHRRRFARGIPEKDFIRNGDPNPIARMLYRGGPDLGLTPADLQHLRDLYDDEISSFDERFGHLVRSLQAGGWLEDSIVVFVSDHGEDFMEHGDVKHCRTVFDSSVRIPLFLHVPGVAPGAIEAPVQNLDIVPTLLDYLGMSAGAPPMDGRSLRPLIETGQAGTPYQFSLGGTTRGVTDGRFKLIQELGRPEAWLFDLQEDPEETKDILATERRSFDRLRSELDAWLADTEGGADEGLRKSRSAEQKLRSLGYLQ